MSWHFSQALVAASSGGISSGGEPSAPLKSLSTPNVALTGSGGREKTNAKH